VLYPEKAPDTLVKSKYFPQKFLPGNMLVFDKIPTEYIARKMVIKTVKGVTICDYLCDICFNAATMFWEDQP
jgi:hypothetical protein